ncbi:MAG: diaminopimelate decarboxylase [Alphaproteobacteria bacterium]
MSIGFHRGPDGGLRADGVALSDLPNHFETPLYVLSASALDLAIAEWQAALQPLQVQICPAIKSHDGLAVVNRYAEAGLGADIVSRGELKRARVAGVPADRIVYSGIGKRDDDLTAAIQAGIHQINVEAPFELERIAHLARREGRIQPIALRVNPDVDAQTHDKIATGRAGDKFGIDWPDVPDLMRNALALDGVRPVGLACHIGSQLTSLAPFRTAWQRLRKLGEELNNQGLDLTRMDLGGGLGVRYTPEDEPPPVAALAGVIADVFGDSLWELTVEPGRSLTASAGLLLTRVIGEKSGGGRRFVVVDGSMTELARPAMYDAWHPIEPVADPGDAPTSLADVVGPVCESGDVLGRERNLPNLKPGDLVAIRMAGAYGITMASAYNARALPGEVMLEDGEARETRRRITADELMTAERF